MPRYQLRQGGVDLIVIEAADQAAANRRAAVFGTGCTAVPTRGGALGELRESGAIAAATDAAEARLAEGLRRFGGLSDEAALIAARGRESSARRGQLPTVARLREPTRRGDRPAAGRDEGARIKEAHGTIARALQRLGGLSESAAQTAAEGRAR